VAQSIMRVHSADGSEILVGRSAAQNDRVTFSLASGSDIWLHAREIPGAHVIIRTGGKPPAPQTLRQAAELAATYSQARGATAVPVDYTFVRHVRRIKGGKPGLVHYSGETTLNVRPTAAEGAAR
jgi:predicted ribosome quality control (RQC) complex YloA/Tae2 family protein